MIGGYFFEKKEKIAVKNQDSIDKRTISFYYIDIEQSAAKAAEERIFQWKKRKYWSLA
ncbi:MAG: hypothetical protein IKT50_01330 [Clostridia bacterium]|nr:hypothetical protein [Clostridia bacterium]